MANIKSNLSRREFIKQLGLAAGVAVPFLRSSVAMGQTTTAPLRVLFVALQHGWGSDRGVARFSGTATNFVSPAPFNAFDSIKNQCQFIDGLRTGFWGNAHDASYADILTSSVPYEAPNNSALGGPFPSPTTASLDWMIGNQHNKNVLRLSHGYQSFGAAHHPLSFDSSLRSLPFFTNARSAYLSVIDPLRQQNQADPTLLTRNNALLTMLGRDANRLLARLSGTERAKMESYLASLNSLGNRINATGTQLGNIQLPSLPGMTLNYNDQMDQYLDMIRIAFTLDTHRVAVLGLGNNLETWPWFDPTTNTNRNGNIFGNNFHHEIAHYDKLPGYLPEPQSRAAYEGWVRWYAGKIVGLVNAMSAINDVDGRPLIDNTLIVLTGEVGNGRHDRHNIVHTVIGGGSRTRRGRWINLPTVEPRNRQGYFWGSRAPDGTRVECGINYGDPVSRHHVADLWVSVARLAGLNINTFGIDVYNGTPIAL